MKRLILMIGLAILTSSCQTTDFVHQKYPIIPTADRPVLSKDLDKDDVKKMVKYAVKLETAIKIYNEFAEKKNLDLDEKK